MFFVLVLSLFCPCYFVFLIWHHKSCFKNLCYSDCYLLRLVEPEMLPFMGFSLIYLNVCYCCVPFLIFLGLFNVTYCFGRHFYLIFGMNMFRVIDSSPFGFWMIPHSICCFLKHTCKLESIDVHVQCTCICTENCQQYMYILQICNQGLLGQIIVTVW